MHVQVNLCMHLIETMKLAGAFVIKEQSTWATYVLYACPFFVSITRNVRPVGECTYCFEVIYPWCMISNCLKPSGSK